MPGRLIQGVKATGVNNPVFLLDEVNSRLRCPSFVLLDLLEMNFLYRCSGGQNDTWDPWRP